MTLKELMNDMEADTYFLLKDENGNDILLFDNFGYKIDNINLDDEEIKDYLNCEVKTTCKPVQVDLIVEINTNKKSDVK